MKWTYDKVRRYAECQRRRARREGCNSCGKMVPNLELAGRPPLSRMTRDGYGIERVKAAIRSRGWFCRSCVKDLTRKENDGGAQEKKKKKQQQCPKSVPSPDKRAWLDDRKFDYCWDVCQGRGSPEDKAKECWEGGDLEEALQIVQNGP